MFGKKNKRTIEVTKLSSLIADNLHIVGDVLFSGGLRVDGKVDGNVIGKKGEKSLVVLSEKGCIVGRVCAYDAVVNGTISGDLEVEHFLELQPGAKVSGNISYRQLQMECGATVDGKLVKVDDAAKEKLKRAALETEHKSAPEPSKTLTDASPLRPETGRGVSGVPADAAAKAADAKS